jgi:hypothetical protein
MRALLRVDIADRLTAVAVDLPLAGVYGSAAAVGPVTSAVSTWPLSG